MALVHKKSVSWKKSQLTENPLCPNPDKAESTAFRLTYFFNPGLSRPILRRGVVALGQTVHGEET